MAEPQTNTRTAEQQAQYEKLVETPIPKLIPKLAVPTVLSMMVTMLYNLADSFFVGKLNTSASASVGIVLAIIAAFQAFGFLFGHGAGTNVSQALGRGDREAANRMASTGFFGAMFFGVLLTVLGLCFRTPLMRALGSTETILPYSLSYGTFVLISGSLYCGSCVLNNILRYEGKAAVGMWGLLSGNIFNMVADPIFMFTFKMGIAGAGLATMLGQTLSFTVLLVLYFKSGTVSTISVKDIDIRGFRTLQPICKNGMPSLIRQLLATFGTTALNISAKPFGDAAIAAMTIDGRVIMFIGSLVLGIGQGFQPVAAYNKGADRPDRIREGYFFTLATGTALVGLLSILALIFPEPIVRLFRDDPEVVAIGAKALRFMCIALFVQPFSMVSTMLFQATGEARIASFLSSLRSGLYFIPILLVLPHLFGLLGLQMAQMWSDLFTALTCLPFVIRYFRNH